MKDFLDVRSDISLSFVDRLRVLFGAHLLCHVRTETENAIGEHRIVLSETTPFWPSRRVVKSRRAPPATTKKEG